MASDHQKFPVEFESEMPDDYDDEEYYGEEDEYAEDGEGEEYDDDPAPAAAKPKGNIVRTALFGVAGVLALGGVAYFAMSMLAPDMLNDVVNNLPFVSHSEDTANASPAPEAGGAKQAKGGKAGEQGGTDVANVPPDPAKAGAMSTKKTGADDDTGEAGASPAAVAKAPRMPKSAGNPPDKVAQAPTNAQPMEGMPMEGAPAKPPTAKTPRKAAPKAAPQAQPMTAAPKTNPNSANAQAMAAARSNWLKRHPHKGVAVASAGGTRYVKGKFLGWSTRTVWIHGRAHRVRTPLYAAVPRVAPKGSYPLATHRTIASLPASWKHGTGGRFAVQIGSFSSSSNASQLVSQLRAQGIAAYTASGSGRSRVFIGSYGNREAAATKMAQLQSQGIPAAVTNQ